VRIEFKTYLIILHVLQALDGHNPVKCDDTICRLRRLKVHQICGDDRQILDPAIGALSIDVLALCL